MKKNHKRMFSMILSLGLCFSMAPMGGSIYAADAVEYLERSWDGKAVTGEKKKVTDYTVVDPGTTSWENGWYVVKDDVDINSRIRVKGSAKLILCDGKTLNANMGITVTDDCALTIYSQAGGTGALNADSTSYGESFLSPIQRYSAAIGGEGDLEKEVFDDCTCGTVIIHGGKITAKASDPSEEHIAYYAAGIGGAVVGEGGDITIYGGDVNACGEIGAGIGSGWKGGIYNIPYGANRVTVYGGKVTATGGASTSVSRDGCGAGIGGGHDSNMPGTVAIYGGEVNASCKKKAGAGIGGGFNCPGAEVIINDGKVKAEGGMYASGIGGGARQKGGNVTVNGGEVLAKGGVGLYSSSSAAIGHGGDDYHLPYKLENKALTVNNGTVYGSDKDEEDLKAISPGEDGDYRRYKYMKISAVNSYTHVHSFTYSASGAVITATCQEKNCSLPESRETLTVKAPKNPEYDGDEKGASLYFSEGSNTEAFKDVKEDAITYTKDEETVDVPVYPGTYTASVTAHGVTAVLKYTITMGGKAEAEILEYPNGRTGLIANGSDQELITPGETEEGVFMYKLGKDGKYGTEIPKAKDEGSYTVYYYVRGDEDHEDTDEKSIEVSIGREEGAEHRTDGTEVTEVTSGNAVYVFDVKKSPAVIAYTKVDISQAFDAVKEGKDYVSSAKHRFRSDDKKVAGVNKKGILSPKKEGRVYIFYEQKVKGGSWTKLGDPLHLYVQRPMMEKKIKVSASDTGLNAYKYLSRTTYSPTRWLSTKDKVASVDDKGNITIHGKGKTQIIAQYGEEGKNGSRKKYKTTLIIKN